MKPRLLAAAIVAASVCAPTIVLDDRKRPFEIMDFDMPRQDLEKAIIAKAQAKRERKTAAKLKLKKL